MILHPEGLPKLPPNTDYITGEAFSDTDLVVDTGVNVDIGRLDPRNGRIYLKLQTIREAARVAGYDLVAVATPNAPKSGDKS